MTMQDSEYVKLAEEAWKEALEIARSSDDWKEEKNDKNTVSQATIKTINFKYFSVWREILLRVGKIQLDGRFTVKYF